MISKFFLDFANIYWQVIQDFNKIAAWVTSILKTTRLPDISKLELENDNGQIIEFNINAVSSMEFAEKPR